MDASVPRGHAGGGRAPGATSHRRSIVHALHRKHGGGARRSAPAWAGAVAPSLDPRRRMSRGRVAGDRTPALLSCVALAAQRGGARTGCASCIEATRLRPYRGGGGAAVAQLGEATPASAPARRGRLPPAFAALGNRDYRLLWLGTLGSFTAMQMQQ